MSNASLHVPRFRFTARGQPLCPLLPISLTVFLGWDATYSTPCCPGDDKQLYEIHTQKLNHNVCFLPSLLHLGALYDA